MPATTAEPKAAAPPAAAPKSAPKRVRKKGSAAFKAASRSSEWAPGCPPPPSLMDAGAFNTWRESMTAEARKRCRGVYVYRKWPLIDMRVLQEFTHIEVLDEHPLDLVGIARRHGGGKYSLVMGYVGARGDKQAQANFEIDVAQHEPKIDVRTLLVDEPGNRAYVNGLKRKGVLTKDGVPVPTEREEMSGLLHTLVEKATSDKGLTQADVEAAIAKQNGGAQKEILAVMGPILSKLAEAGLSPREPTAPPGLDLQGLAAILEAVKPQPPTARDDTLLLELLKERRGGGGMPEALAMFKDMLGLAKTMGGNGEPHWATHFATPLAEGIQAATAFFQMRAAEATAAAGGGFEAGAAYQEGPQALEGPNPMAVPVLEFLEASAPMLLPMIQDPKKSGTDAATLALPFLAGNPAVAEALLALGVQPIIDLFDQAPAYQAATLSEARLRQFVGDFLARLEELKNQAQAADAGAAA